MTDSEKIVIRAKAMPKPMIRQYDPERNCQDEYAQYLSGVITYDIWHKYYDGLPIGMTKYGKVLNPEYKHFVWDCMERMFPDNWVWDEQTLMLYINYKGDLDYFTVIVGTPKGRAPLNVPYNPFEIWGRGKACPVYPEQWHMNKMDTLNYVLDYFRLFCDGDICKLDAKIRNKRSDEWNDVTGRIIEITGNTFTVEGSPLNGGELIE